MIMQITEEERKNEPFLGVSGQALSSFVSRGENVKQLAQRRYRPVLTKWK